MSYCTAQDRRWITNDQDSLSFKSVNLGRNATKRAETHVVGRVSDGLDFRVFDGLVGFVFRLRVAFVVGFFGEESAAGEGVAECGGRSVRHDGEEGAIRRSDQAN